MGIKNGASDIITVIKRGLYNKHARSYKIIVDGELMRYKGMIECNLTKHNAEEAIAATSFDYMQRQIEQIELFIGRRANEIIVFMDGSRVFNKESGRADFKFDAGLIRITFKTICFQHGYTMNELVDGESELQMYLLRDKTMDLNVFLTNDSDMISICYGHTPTLKYIKDTLSDEDALCSVIDRQGVNVANNTTSEIIDMNQIYNLNKVKISDSCLWINSGKTVTAVGFDFIERRVHFNTLSFRTFISFCGTDFTSSLFTDSMISGILLSDRSDIEFINSLEDSNDIAGCLLAIGVRAGGTIKRFDDQAKKASFSPYDIDASTKKYLEYIETGKMTNSTMIRSNMGLATRHYLYAMKGQDSCFIKKSLTVWAGSTSLEECVFNLKMYLGTFDPNSKPGKTNKAVSRKRPRSTSIDLASTSSVLPRAKNLRSHLGIIDPDVTPSIETKSGYNMSQSTDIDLPNFAYDSYSQDVHDDEFLYGSGTVFDEL